MRTVALFKKGKYQALRLPKEFEFTEVTEVEITREGNSIILTPRRKSWTSFSSVAKADVNLLHERADVLDDE